MKSPAFIMNTPPTQGLAPAALIGRLLLLSLLNPCALALVVAVLVELRQHRRAMR